MSARVVADGPVLFFGGPYSNLEATRAVLDALSTGLRPSCDVLPPAERAMQDAAITPATLVWHRGRAEERGAGPAAWPRSSARPSERAP